MKNVLLTLFCGLALQAFPQKYVGGDISLLPTMETAGAQYKTHDGQPIADPLAFFAQEGMNAMRVRLFVDPSAYTGSDKDANACQDLTYVLPLAQRIKRAGHKLLLDIHYSDTWADPGKQWTPAAWQTLSDAQLEQQVYDYTAQVLRRLQEAGAAPDFVQTGNEISFGMLWGRVGTAENRCYIDSPDTNWTRFLNLLKRATAACREVLPEARIVLHSERTAGGAANVLRDWLQRLQSHAIDYDIIGMSYYPAYHGAMSNLRAAIGVAEDFEKDIWIVETGYALKWATSGTSFDYTGTYPYTDEGQRRFTADLIAMLNQHDRVKGLFWWWMEYNAFGTRLSGWYNAPLFDSQTGRATSALGELKHFRDNEANAILLPLQATSDQSWYCLNGQRVSRPASAGIYIRDGKKVSVIK